MDKIRFREVLRERERIATECQDEWDYGIEQCWQQEIEILTEDVTSTMDYLLNDCTADEYVWISEVLDDITEQVHNSELVACYKSLMIRFPEETQKYNIPEVIKCSEDIIKGGLMNGENQPC